MRVMKTMITKSDFDKICRICLEMKNNTQMNQFTIDIKSMLQFCTTRQLNDNKQLPSQICNDCVNNVNKYYEFKKQCEHSEQVLNELLSNDNDNDDKTWFENYQIKFESTNNIDDRSATNDNVIDNKKEESNYHDDKQQKDSNDEFYDDNVDDDTDTELDNDNNIEQQQETIETYNKNKLSKRKAQINWVMTLGADKCDINQLLCMICSKTLAHIGSLARHMEIHESDRKYCATCKICDKGFYDQTNYYKHLERHTGDVKKHKCDKCDKTFYELSKLATHLRNTHKIDAQYKCTECNKEYVIEEQYNLHMKKHSNEYLYKCQICDKGYHLQHRLQKHIINTHEKTFYCQICDKTYKNHTSLKNHTDRYHPINNQSLIKQSCHICGKIVLHMKRHMLVHNAARSFQCQSCDKSFLFNSDLVAHVKRVHDETNNTPILPYLCNVCGKRRASQSALDQHILHAHTTEKTKKCLICGKYYKTDSALHRHIRFSHKNDRRFKCTVCTKVFYTNAMLRIHMRTHTGERPYQCVICMKAFVQSCTLKTHMKVHKGADQSIQ